MSAVRVRIDLHHWSSQQSRGKAVKGKSSQRGGAVKRRVVTCSNRPMTLMIEGVSSTNRIRFDGSDFRSPCPCASTIVGALRGEGRALSRGELEDSGVSEVGNFVSREMDVRTLGILLDALVSVSAVSSLR